MHYLVTGGAGFIGSHIAEALLKRGDQPVILDNMYSGRTENLDANPNAVFIEGSIMDTDLLDKICTEYNIHGIFHLAAVASVQKSIENPAHVHEINATGTLNILEAARKHNIRKVVLSASAAAYGDNPIFPKKEDMLPEPLSPYAVSKIAGEMYCKTYAELYGIQTVSLRYFNVFGPRQDPNGEYAAVIPKFTEKICAGESPTVFGDGEQTRDFVFVKDVARANLLAMDSDVSGLFNIGTGIQTSLNNLAEMIMQAAGKTVEMHYEKARDGDVRYSVADISKAGEYLGYQPEFDLAEGIRETVAYFNSL